jgi:hypothetical protein
MHFTAFHRRILAPLLLIVAASAAAQQRAPNHRYEQLVIAQPQDQSTVFDNSGRVPVSIVISPALSLAPGEQLQLFLDGRPVTPTQDGDLALENVDRGSHQLQARIVDRGGATLIQSEPVTFFMWQASRNFPSRRH